MFAAFIIGALTNYAFNVGMGWLLTPEQYGMLGVCVSFLIIFSLFVTSAFPLTVTKFISSENEESVKHRVFKSALIANVTIAIILSILFYFGYYTGMIKLGANYNLLVINIIITTMLILIIFLIVCPSFQYVTVKYYCTTEGQLFQKFIQYDTRRYYRIKIKK